MKDGIMTQNTRDYLLEKIKKRYLDGLYIIDINDILDENISKEDVIEILEDEDFQDILFSLDTNEGEKLYKVKFGFRGQNIFDIMDKEPYGLEDIFCNITIKIIEERELEVPTNKVFINFNSLFVLSMFSSKENKLTVTEINNYLIQFNLPYHKNVNTLKNFLLDYIEYMNYLDQMTQNIYYEKSGDTSSDYYSRIDSYRGIEYEGEQVFYNHGFVVKAEEEDNRLVFYSETAISDREAILIKNSVLTNQFVNPEDMRKLMKKIDCILTKNNLISLDPKIKNERDLELEKLLNSFSTDRNLQNNMYKLEKYVNRRQICQVDIKMDFDEQSKKMVFLPIYTIANKGKYYVIGIGINKVSLVNEIYEKAQVQHIRMDLIEEVKGIEAYSEELRKKLQELRSKEMWQEKIATITRFCPITYKRIYSYMIPDDKFVLASIKVSSNLMAQICIDEFGTDLQIDFRNDEIFVGNILSTEKNLFTFLKSYTPGLGFEWVKIDKVNVYDIENKEIKEDITEDSIRLIMDSYYNGIKVYTRF